MIHQYYIGTILAKALYMSGGDHIHAGIVVDKPESECKKTLGLVDLLHNDFQVWSIEKFTHKFQFKVSFYT